jgi:Type III secretion system lipoprotein chaperone (YscW)
MARVKVRIEWPDNLQALPEHAQARVTVEDVTQADASSVVLAERVLDDLTADQEAVTQLEVGEVDPRAYLVVRVHVTDAGRQTREVEVGDLVSTQSHPVLTRGHGDSVVVRPRVVGS